MCYYYTMKNKIKAIFFDIDNTILSFDEYVKDVMQKGFKKFGLKPYEDSMFLVFTRINNQLWLDIEKASITMEELTRIRWNLIFNELSIDYDGPSFEKYFREQLNESAIPEKDALEVLTKLSNTYELFAASNGPYEQQLNRLSIGNMLPLFSNVFVSEKIGVSKPDVRFFEESFREINKNRDKLLSPIESLMVGDSLTSDMAGAKSYGLHTCFYNRFAKDVSNNPLVDFSINQLSELLDALQDNI